MNPLNRFQSRFIQKVGNRGTLFSWVGGGPPPVGDKLMVWLPGANTSNVLKRDTKSGYDFLIKNCPPDYWLNELGEVMTDELGEGMYSTFLFNGWGCEYLAPAAGSPGNTELLAVDVLDILYTAGASNTLTKAGMLLWSNGQAFFSEEPGKGVLFYNQVLTGDDLSQVQNWIS